jgi:predicted nucleic-acid-binding protein
MIGLDTNILVRYLTQDDARQSKAATRLLEDQCTPSTPAFVNDVVLCELVWVLEEAYEYTRSQIAGVLEQIIRTAQLRVSNPARIWRAVARFREGYDFADAMIAEMNSEQGCDHTVTLDRRFSQLPGVKLLSV